MPHSRHAPREQSMDAVRRHATKFSTPITKKA
jgi:hypothetical protein